jgi:hypothetical protein
MIHEEQQPIPVYATEEAQERDQEKAREALHTAFAYLLGSKPDDRSEKDRCYAIAITEMQKLVAFFEYWIVQG